MKLGRIAGGAGALLFAIVAMATMGAAGLTAPSEAACAASSPMLTGGVSGLPAAAQRFAPLYVGAGERYGLGVRGPAILASIHQTESGFGANQGPSSAGAVGQMQFLPSTWSAYAVDGDDDRRADPADAADAIYTAAHYLSASGAPGDWYAAIFTYNHADWYVQEILAGARAFGDLGEAADATTASCSGSLAGGPVDLTKAIRVYEPARDQRVPDHYVAPGFGPIVIDARIWPNVQWVLDTYGLVLTAGKETGHASHGDGSAIDAVPAQGVGSLAHWDQTAGRLARDLGWSPGCAGSGVRPVCGLVPAIEFVGYNGYDGSHGDLAHSSTPHIHVSWVSSTHGTPYLTTPDWMLVFPSPVQSSEASTVSTRTGSQVLVVGDSLSVGARPYLEEKLGSRVTVDAETSRPSSVGLDVLRGRLSAEEDVVVFDLGTNDDPGRPQVLADHLRQARQLAGDRCLVVATVNRPDARRLNDAIRGFTDASHAVLYDWHRIAQSEGLLESDGIHATADGYRRRAAGELEAIRAC